MSDYVIRLYVTGDSARSRVAIANLRNLCLAQVGQPCDIAIIDVLQRPDLAESERILATPTLIRYKPLPIRRIVGDLSDLDTVHLVLDLPHQGPSTAGYQPDQLKNK